MQPSKGTGRLPPPPAPTARDANPWKFSDTARATRPNEPAGYERLLAELEEARGEREGPADAAPREPAAGPEPEPESAPAPRRESAFNAVFPLVILLIMIGSFAREVIEQEGYDDPRLAIVAAVALAAVIGAVILARRSARRRRSRR
ncbi:MAG: hypothetical protein MUC71_00090 [Steroidobacteraceae bacterium]|nr:hypothetical protein [Steroidobacteraceae bacterium]